MAVPAYPADKERRGLALETCTIMRWRGYVTSTFVAVLADGAPVAESASFRAKGAADPPDAGDARTAFDGLCSTLEVLGWDFLDEPADVWYAVRFGRQVEVAVVAIEAPEAAPRPPAPRPPAPRRLAPPPVAPPKPAPPPAAPPELPPAAEKAAKPGRPSRRIVVVSTVGIVAALALGGDLALKPTGHKAASPPAPAPVVSTPKLHAAKPAHAVHARVPVQKPARTAAVVRIDISAPERASWLEIRRGSATGPVLFSGDLSPGRHLQLKGKRLWARFGAASNLAIRANGRPVSFIGTYEHVFAAKK
jgi:hypothetical protein